MGMKQSIYYRSLREVPAEHPSMFVLGRVNPDGVLGGSSQLVSRWQPSFVRHLGHLKGEGLTNHGY